MVGRSSILWGVVIAASGTLGTPLYACEIDCVLIRPDGVITSADSVSMEIYLSSRVQNPLLAEPIQVSVVGNRIVIDVYRAEWAVYLAAPDGLTEIVEVGPLPDGFYTYEVTQHANADCPERVLVGTLCVQDTVCIGPHCICNPAIPLYETRVLDPDRIDNDRAQAVNDYGHIAGRAYQPEGGQVAFLDVDGVRTYLGTLRPTDSMSYGSDLNNQDDVVGYSWDGSFTRATLWRDGGAVDLGTLGQDSQGTGINDAGEIVGWSKTLDGSFPVYWPNGSKDALVTLGETHGRAFDINEGGVIVGSAWTETGVRAALWRDDVLTDLGTLGGYAEALGINEDEQVVGRSRRDDGTSWYHAFLWEGGVMIDLGALWGFERSEAIAINDRGQILGEARVDGVELAFVYDPQLGIQWLQHAMEPGEECWDVIPYDLGDGGHIVGYRELYAYLSGGAVLLSLLPAPENTPPVPAASFWSLSALTLLVLSAGTIVLIRRDKGVVQSQIV